MKSIKVLTCLMLIIALCMVMTVPAFATAPTATPTPTPDPANPTFTKVVDPIVKLLNSLVRPMLAIVAAVGSLYCVILGVKYAKAEEPQDREKAKQHLKNAIIGFVIIFVLILALNVLKDPLIDWVNANAGSTVIK